MLSRRMFVKGLSSAAAVLGISPAVSAIQKPDLKSPAMSFVPLELGDPQLKAQMLQRLTAAEIVGCDPIKPKLGIPYAEEMVPADKGLFVALTLQCPDIKDAAKVTFGDDAIKVPLVTKIRLQRTKLMRAFTDRTMPHTADVSFIFLPVNEQTNPINLVFGPKTDSVPRLITNEAKTRFLPAAVHSVHQHYYGETRACVTEVTVRMPIMLRLEVPDGNVSFLRCKHCEHVFTSVPAPANHPWRTEEGRRGLVCSCYGEPPHYGTTFEIVDRPLAELTEIHLNPTNGRIAWGNSLPRDIFARDEFSRYQYAITLGHKWIWTV